MHLKIIIYVALIYVENTPRRIIVSDGHTINIKIIPRNVLLIQVSTHHHLLLNSFVDVTKGEMGYIMMIQI